MTTLQPRLVRADTLDLQSHDAPSAKDHTRSPTFSPYQQGQPGPHHREALRNAEESAYNDRRHSPRVSMDDPNRNMVGQTHLYDSAEESAEEEHHDGTNGVAQHDADYDHGEGDEDQDEDVDDDLMDKISSSPSIEDGKYSLPSWPSLLESMDVEAALASSPLPIRGILPFPLHHSIQPSPMTEELETGPAIHHPSEYGYIDPCRISPQHSEPTQRTGSLSRTSTLPNLSGSLGFDRSENSADSISKYLLPVDDSLLDIDSDDNVYYYDDPDHQEHENEEDWIDEDICYGNTWNSDDETEDFSFTLDSRFIDSGWGGECLRETEDIDFEFVYALHTFVATVEGQANATKGDTMVLLDDSNSYWWLVRVVKDGSIGYLPAEHIETPTERLARLNKHRNIDLSASMLGDNPEKSKNPLKKAMRRRNAKSVAFAAPTYYEPSLYSYTSDEEDEEGEDVRIEEQQQAQRSQQNVSDGTQAENMNVVLTNGVTSAASDETVAVEAPGSPIKTDTSDLTGPQVQQDENFQRSRNGVVRNTDSFFKDDTVETKKISLTPRLLRNDTDSNSTTEPARERMSAETFDKVIAEDKSKDDKKKKEKKGMLSGLFKRSKDRKGSKIEPEDVHAAEESAVSPKAKDSLESLSTVQSPERKPSKLQKAPKSPLSPKMSPLEISTQRVMSPTSTTPISTTPLHSPQASISPNGPSDANMKSPEAIVEEQARTEQTPNRFPSLTEKRSIFSPITTALKSPPPGETEPVATTKPVFAKKAKERFAIDDSDSEDDSTPRSTMVSQHHRSISPMRDSMLAEPRPDSAMQVSPIEQTIDHYTQDYQQGYKYTNHDMTDEEATTPIDVQMQSDTASTSKPSPSLATHTPSTSRSTPTWSDASLRSYMESDRDIRDLLIIVHDKSNVTPVGPDHPLMGGLFMTERTRLAEMQTQLDSMLTGWITKKNPGLLVK